MFAGLIRRFILNQYIQSARTGTRPSGLPSGLGFWDLQILQKGLYRQLERLGPERPVEAGLPNPDGPGGDDFPPGWIRPVNPNDPDRLGVLEHAVTDLIELVAAGGLGLDERSLGRANIFRGINDVEQHRAALEQHIEHLDEASRIAKTELEGL